jgi:uncharacterized membrane protein
MNPIKKTYNLVESPEIFHVIIEYVILIIEIIVGILVAGIVIMTLGNLLRSLLTKIRKRQQQVHVREIVTRMLRGLLIVLDFLIAADLLQTILDPSLEETAVLALVVVLRILLSWSLSKEIEMSTKEKSRTEDKTL